MGDPVPVLHPTRQPQGHSATGVSSLLGSTGTAEGCFWGKQRIFRPKSPKPGSFSTLHKDRLHPVSPGSTAASRDLKGCAGCLRPPKLRQAPSLQREMGVERWRSLTCWVKSFLSRTFHIIASHVQLPIAWHHVDLSTQ